MNKFSTASAVFISATALLLNSANSALSQQYITTLERGLNVVATANLGENNPTVVTLQDRVPIHCRGASIETYDACVEEAEELGMFKITWEVDCADLLVSISNEFVSDRVQEIDPNLSPVPNAVYGPYVIYDYACGTSYTN